jgi:hypothetical protein
LKVVQKSWKMRIIMRREMDDSIHLLLAPFRKVSAPPFFPLLLPPCAAEVLLPEVDFHQLIEIMITG